MRLWHKDLIPVLPDAQLRGQWRECCLIAKLLSEDKLNHLLVNKVKEYPDADFNTYTKEVYLEMKWRGYNVDFDKFQRYRIKPGNDLGTYIYEEYQTPASIFRNWHDDTYLKQCYYNLEEKYNCGGIKFDEMLDILEFLKRLGYDFMYN